MEFEDLKELLKKDRSVRRFDEGKPMGEDILQSLVELTRYCASGRNLQPLRYRIVTDLEERDEIFPLLSWAGYFPDWGGPEEGERPTAYLIQCLDTRITKNCLCDDGLQLQAITLGATALRIGCCIIKSFEAGPLKETLNFPEWVQIQYVLALGYPREEVVIESFVGDIKYYRTLDGVHHVPKRSVRELLI